MIENLPKTLNQQQLHSINFGNIEANDDRLLFDSICKTNSMIEFLNGEKNIVLGEKGTGKTALFRLIKEHKIAFSKKDNCENLIIAIEDNFDYKNIKTKLLQLIKVDNNDEEFVYQIIWELFLFQKIIKHLRTKDELVLNETIQKGIDLIDKVLSQSLNENLLKVKRTVGVRLYETGGFLMPDIYLTAESKPEEDNSKSNSLEQLEINLDSFKAEINKLLKANNLRLIILIDRLDEFVSKSVQTTQLQMLEALICTEREWGRYSQFELKILLRDDLFKQLKFEGIGYDKVITKKVDLIWTPEKIREFIAKRIIYNYLLIFDLESLRLTLDNQTIEIDTNINDENYAKPYFWVRFYRYLVKKFNKKHYSQLHARKRSLTDNFSIHFIQSFFPRYIDYKNEEGKIIEMDIFDFWGQMFNLGTGNSIPRLILIFLDKLMMVTKNYYQNNFDQLPIKANNEGCYEIIKKGFFKDAYEAFKNDIYINFAKLNPEFEELIMLFKEKIGNKYSLKPRDLKALLNLKTDEEVMHFCNYLLHIGMLKKTNNTNIIGDMKFELPIMFRSVK